MSIQSKGETTLAIAKTRAKPILIKLDTGKVICSSGRWNDEVMTDYMVNHANGKWVSIGELASVAFGGSNIRNKKYTRKKLASLFRALRSTHNELMIAEYTGRNGAAQHIKLADLSDEQDRQALLVQIEKRRRMKEVTEREYDLVMASLRARGVG